MLVFTSFEALGALFRHCNCWVLIISLHPLVHLLWTSVQFIYRDYFLSQTSNINTVIYIKYPLNLSDFSELPLNVFIFSMLFRKIVLLEWAYSATERKINYIAQTVDNIWTLHSDIILQCGSLSSFKARINILHTSAGSLYRNIPCRAHY